MRCLILISYLESSVDQLPGDARSSVLFGQQRLGASDCKKERKYSEKGEQKTRFETFKKKMLSLIVQSTGVKQKSR